MLKIGTFVHFHMYNHNLCSLVVSDCEFTVTPSNMCGISLYLKLCEFSTFSELTVTQMGFSC